MYIKSVDQSSTSEDTNCSYFPLPKDTIFIPFLRLPSLPHFSLQQYQSGPQYHSIFNYD